MNPRPPLEVVCAVIEDAAGRVLACRRGPGMAMAGKWEFPGGKREPGEDPRAALRRELLEELGVESEVGAALAAVDHDYDSFTIRLLPFRCRLTGGALHAHEHDELRWVDRTEALLLDWAAADVPVVEEWVR
jgi:8-oxo-dGTP diphosphatase